VADDPTPTTNLRDEIDGEGGPDPADPTGPPTPSTGGPSVPTDRGDTVTVAEGVSDDSIDETIDQSGGGGMNPDIATGLDAAPGTGALAGRLGHLDLDVDTAPPPPAPDPGQVLDLDFGAGAPSTALADATRTLEVDASPASSFDGAEQPFDQPYVRIDASWSQSTEVDLGPEDVPGPTEIQIDDPGGGAPEPSPDDIVD
jgi:hypothetical protein